MLTQHERSLADLRAVAARAYTPDDDRHARFARALLAHADAVAELASHLVNASRASSSAEQKAPETRRLSEGAAFKPKCPECYCPPSPPVASPSPPPVPPMEPDPIASIVISASVLGAVLVPTSFVVVMVCLCGK